MWGDMSLWNVLLHSGDHIVPRILTVDYTFNVAQRAYFLKRKISRYAGIVSIVDKTAYKF